MLRIEIGGKHFPIKYSFKEVIYSSPVNEGATSTGQLKLMNAFLFLLMPVKMGVPFMWSVDVRSAFLRVAKAHHPKPQHPRWPW